MKFSLFSNIFKFEIKKIMLKFIIFVLIIKKNIKIIILIIIIQIKILFKNLLFLKNLNKMKSLNDLIKRFSI